MCNMIHLSSIPSHMCCWVFFAEKDAKSLDDVLDILKLKYCNIKLIQLILNEKGKKEVRYNIF